MGTFITRSEGETMNLAQEFASRRLKIGDLVALYGELGSGKTRFIQGICRGLGVKEHVASPTFTIVNEYNFPGGKIFHFDFYRVHSTAEILDVGFEEYINNEGICLIEWADRAKGLLPHHRYDVRLNFAPAERERAITIEETVGVLT